MKKNWYIEAKKCGIPEVKELLAQYENLDAEDVKRIELKEQIKKLLPVDVKVVEKKEEPVKNLYDLDFSFKYTEQDVRDSFDVSFLENVYKESLIRVDELKKQRKRPEYETYQERIEFDTKLWAVERIGLQANNKARQITFDIRKREKASSPLSKMAYKRNLFITDYLKGISISNIVVNHSAEFGKEDLKLIINKDVIEKIERDCDKYFGEKWARWQKKFLDSKNV